jgi:signal transduction histidine kinase
MYELSRHRALAVDIVLALTVTAGILQIDKLNAAGRGPGVAVLTMVLVLMRRRYPEIALAVGTAAAVLSMIAAWERTSGLFLLLGVLTYAAALYSRKRRPWHYAVAVWGVVVLTGWSLDFSGWWSPDQFGLFAWIFGGAGAGDSIRMRRAYIAEVTERARQAEQTREEEARRRVIDERLRIARELHDVVAHHIAVISVQAGAAGHALRDQPERVWPVLGQIRQAADTVLEEIKSVVGVLRDPAEVPSTEPAPGLERLPDLLTGLDATGFRVDYRQDGTARKLPAVVDLAAYRIVQEALTNAHRYGDGTARLEVAYSPDQVTVEVTNTIASSGTGDGFGLLGMRERATAAHGTIAAGPFGRDRFRVHAELPADAPAMDWEGKK